MLRDLMEERSQLWVIGQFKAVCITQIVVRATSKALWVYYVAGDDMEDWLSDLVALLRRFGKEKECGSIEFSGRRGWLKTLAPHGFKEALVTMRAKL